MEIFGDASQLPKFTPTHICCDICARSCNCLSCHPNDTSTCSTEEVEVLTTCICSIPEKECTYSAELEKKIMAYRDNVYTALHPTASYLLNYQLATGLTDGTIKRICSNYTSITNTFQLVDMGVIHPDHADALLKIVNQHNE